MKYLENTFKIMTIIGVFALFWYAGETHRLRVASEEQAILSIRPYIDFIADPNPYTITNKSNNVATNIFIFTKGKDQYSFMDEKYVGSALAPGASGHFDKNKEIIISKDELMERIPKIRKLIEYLDNKETNCLIVVYEDLFGNKLFSVVYGSGDEYDKATETKYIDDLK